MTENLFLTSMAVGVAVFIFIGFHGFVNFAEHMFTMEWQFPEQPSFSAKFLDANGNEVTR